MNSIVHHVLIILENVLVVASRDDSHLINQYNKMVYLLCKLCKTEEQPRVKGVSQLSANTNDAGSAGIVCKVVNSGVAGNGVFTAKMRSCRRRISCSSSPENIARIHLCQGFLSAKDFESKEEVDPESRSE